MGRRWVGAVAAMLVVLGACGSDPESAPAPAASARASATAPPIVPAAEFCAVTLPDGATQRSLPAADAVSLNTVWLGSGATTAVLLHQTDGNGLCGFLFYADYLARRGVRVVVVDLCNHGQSYCGRTPLTNDPAGQVAAAARADGAQRVVLVGASMGGSVAVTAARAARADGIVDLSGPAVFTVSDISTDAAKVTMPALFVYAHSDQSDLTAVRKALPSMPSTDKTFLTFDSGHGYDLLRDLSTGDFTRLARQVAGFVSDGKVR